MEVEAMDEAEAMVVANKTTVTDLIPSKEVNHRMAVDSVVRNTNQNSALHGERNATSVARRTTSKTSVIRVKTDPSQETNHRTDPTAKIENSMMWKMMNQMSGNSTKAGKNNMKTIVVTHMTPLPLLAM